MSELETALDHHELIKVKLRCDRETRDALSLEIAARCGAEIVHRIGQVSCYFRRNPKKQAVQLP